MFIIVCFVVLALINQSWVLHEHLVAALSLTKELELAEPDILAPTAPPSPRPTPTTLCQSLPSVLERFHLHKPQRFTDDAGYKNGVRSLSENEVVCEYYAGFLWQHFPHAMEMIYPCLSLWRAFPDRRPVLYVSLDKAQRAKLPSQPFLAGMVLALHEAMGVELRYEPSSPSIAFTKDKNWHQPYYVNPIEDLLAMRAAMVDYYLSSTSHPVCPAKVRVGIIDRQNTRRLLNLDRVHDVIEETLGDRLESVKVIAFEGKSFVEQIAFTADIDFLITPHGAQLTLIPFLSPCASVLEIYVPGYYVPYFFGSLAQASGHAFYSVFVGGEMAAISPWQGVRHHETVMSQNACAPIPTVREGLLRMLQDYQQCCQSIDS